MRRRKGDTKVNMENLLSLQEFVGGALQEKVNVAMQEVLSNMQNPDTSWKQKRQINIKLSFTQNENRDDAAVEVSVSTKTAPISPMVTRMLIGKDLQSGEVYAQEYGRQIKGQMSLNLNGVQKIGSDTVDTETGEVLEPGKVVDLRKASI